MRKRNLKRRIVITDEKLKIIEVTNPELAKKIRLAQKSNKRVDYQNVLESKQHKTKEGGSCRRLVRKIHVEGVVYQKNSGGGIIFRHPLKRNG